jgi:hypothetical protein
MAELQSRPGFWGPPDQSYPSDGANRDAAHLARIRARLSGEMNPLIKHRRKKKPVDEQTEEA